MQILGVNKIQVSNNPEPFGQTDESGSLVISCKTLLLSVCHLEQFNHLYFLQPYEPEPGHKYKFIRWKGAGKVAHLPYPREVG